MIVHWHYLSSVRVVKKVKILPWKGRFWLPLERGYDAFQLKGVRVTVLLILIINIYPVPTS